MTNAQTEAQAIADELRLRASREQIVLHHHARAVDKLATALAAKDAELAAAWAAFDIPVSARKPTLSEHIIAALNELAKIAADERARAERAEAQIAEPIKALEPFAFAASAYLIEELDDEYRPDW